MNRLNKIAAWIGAALCLPATAWPQAPEITVELPGGVPLEMVWIEPGTFLMGPTPEREDDSDNLKGPQHEVTITRGFYIGKFEVTQEQWSSIMGTRPWAEYSYADCASCPANGLSWTEAEDFVNRVDKVDGGSFFRLPTEAEWEYVARAGTSTAYWFGDSPDRLADFAWFEENSRDPFGPDSSNISSSVRRFWVPRPVGLKPPNPWGLYDVHGNVHEYVQDLWRRIYTAEKEVDPVNLDKPLGDLRHMRRGGAVLSLAQNCESAFRQDDEEIQLSGLRILMQSVQSTNLRNSSWGEIKE